MQTYGYIRVSARDQNVARQLDALAPFGIPPKNLYVEKQSGKDFCRPAYQRLLRRLAPGDLLVVKSIDRLGRSYGEILDQWRIITREKEADILVVDFPLLDTRVGGGGLTGRFIADLTLQVLAYVAQAERENIHQRQAEGIASARARGVRFGPPVKELPADFECHYRAWQEGSIPLETLLERCHMRRSTFYKRLREYRQSGQDTENRIAVPSGTQSG